MDPAPTLKSAAPSRSSSVKNPKAWILGWLPAALGLVAWIASPFDDSGWIESLKFLGIFTAVAISVVIHELAHFVAGRSLGLKPWCLRIGHGEVVFDKEFHSFRLILQSLPYSGAVYPYLAGERSDKIRMICAGPLSNAALFLIFLPGFLLSPDLSDFTSISMQWFLANACLLLGSAIPRHTSTGSNDAMMIVQLLRGTSPAPSKKTGSRLNLWPSWSWIIKHHPLENFLDQHRQHLKNPDISTEQRCQLLDAFATCVLMYGTGDIDEADRYSEELLRLKPNEWTVKGTRGAVLVEKGDLPEGIAMLEEVMAHDSNQFDRAISSGYLALAKWKQGDGQEALRWLGIAREIDAQCPSTIRIGKFVESETSSR
jgi:hypothetical protein